MKAVCREAAVPFRGSGCFGFLKALFPAVLGFIAARASASFLSFSPVLQCLCFGAVFLFCFFLQRFLDQRLSVLRRSPARLLLTLLCGFGLQFFVPLGKSVVWVLLLAAVYAFLGYALPLPSERPLRCFSTVLGSFFALCIYLGYQLKTFGALTVFGSTLGGMLLTAGLPGLAVLFTLLLHTLLVHLEGIRLQDQNAGRLFSGKGRFFLLAGLIFLCWLPYFAAFAPAIITEDTADELYICLGEQPLSNHHPILHQLTLRVFVALIPDLFTAVALATLTQMLLLASLFAACLLFMARRGMSRGILLSSLAFFSLYTVNAFFSVTLWKDIWFGMAALLFLLLLLRDADSPEKGRGALIGRILLLSLAGFLFCTLRNNGWYAFLLTFPLYILVRRKDLKKLCTVFVLTAALVLGYRFLIFDVFGAQKSASGEMLSIPLQQVARVVTLKGFDETDADLQVLSELFTDIREIPERYRPVLSDSIKLPDFFLSSVFDADRGRYLRAWAGLGLRHPIEYLEAFLFQNYGYWYPDEAYWTAPYFSNVKGLPLEQSMDFFLIRVLLFKLHSFLSEMTPLAILTSPGFIFWLLLLAAALLLIKKKGQAAAPMLLLFGVWITTLASPVYCEYRYIYALVTCLPLCIGLALSEGKE